LESVIYDLTMHRAGFVTIIGNPNVGKSTLMNALVGEKISIITSKAQTTRHRIMGIVNGEDFQIVYSDTPGILKPGYGLQEFMRKYARSALTDSDIILYVTDVIEEQTIDEILEAIWTCREEQEPTISRVLQIAHTQTDTTSIQYLVDRGWISQNGDQLQLTPSGEKKTALIIRRHRLAERLFVDVLGMQIEQIEAAACSFEHTVVPEVTQGLCTLLGHPQECPHGKPIPPGKCCREGRKEITQALMPLNEIPCGKLARVAYIRPQHHDRLHLLLSLGISPGIELKLHQRTPVLVVQIEQSELAMDREVAEDIYVWLDPKA